MYVSVHDERKGFEQLSVNEIAAIAPSSFTLEQRVPGVPGTAFDLKTWYRAWTDRLKNKHDEEPTHLLVEAADEFQATIPWNQLDQAAILYEHEGMPLKKGFPIRLYVPDGSSNCLNVKSLVKVNFMYNRHLGEEATFGFKNVVTVDDLKKT